MCNKIILYNKFIPSTIIVWVLVLLIVLVSCKSSLDATINSNKWNLSKLYNPASSELHPGYKVFHNSSSTSLLYFKVYTNELLFQPIGEQGALKSEISVGYTLLNAGDKSNSIADSGSYNYSVYKNSTGAFYLSQIPLKTEMGNSYRLKIVLRDKLRNTSNISYLEVEKQIEYGQQFFNITGADDKPLFKNVLIGKGSIKVQHINPPSDKLYISYYLNETSLPKPTFATGSDEFVYGKPDSVFVFDYSPTTSVFLNYEGMYFLQFDTTSSEGIALSRFSDDFPKITSPDELVEPLAYITTSVEYDKMKSDNNKKIAADNFWIKSGGSTGRGREMIRVFYNRVYFANYYFTNTKPGWKTDRGMVYIVYGSPHNLKKSADSEIWYYYRRKNGEAISFKFDYKPSKYSLNQYQLERSENNTWHWREAVYSWTNGEIFLQD